VWIGGGLCTVVRISAAALALCVLINRNGPVLTLNKFSIHIISQGEHYKNSALNVVNVHDSA
jgi:hypothetical protein